MTEEQKFLSGLGTWARQRKPRSLHLPCRLRLLIHAMWLS